VSKKFWYFSFYFFLFATYPAVFSFIVLYYQELGFTGARIGVLTGITPLVTFFSAPLWTGFADATHRHRLMMSLVILLALITLLFFPLLHAFLPVLLGAILLYAFFSPITPFADSATMFVLSGEKEYYGRIRLGGTIGYGIVAPVAGILVQHYGLKIAFWGSAMILVVALIISQKLTHGQIKTTGSAGGRLRTLLSNPRWLLFSILAFAGGLGFATYNNFLFPYMRELGANETSMGLALMIGTFTEIPTLFFGNRLIKYFKAYGLLTLSMVVISVRMLLFAAAGTPALILAIQLLNGLTIPAMWIAGVAYADQNAPPGMSATVQGVFNALVFGVGSAMGGFFGGLLLDSISGRGLYLVFGLVVLTILAAVWSIHRRLPIDQDAAPQAGSIESGSAH